MHRIRYKFQSVSAVLSHAPDAKKTMDEMAGSVYTSEFSAEDLDDILVEFTHFLRGSGFYFIGNVVIEDTNE